jgi:meckelin
LQLAMDTWAEVIFYFLFGVTGYWFCFFKFQESIYVLMPPMSDYTRNYRPYEVALCIGCYNYRYCFT